MNIVWSGPFESDRGDKRMLRALVGENEYGFRAGFTEIGEDGQAKTKFNGDLQQTQDEAKTEAKEFVSGLLEQRAVARERGSRSAGGRPSPRPPKQGRSWDR